MKPKDDYPTYEPGIRALARDAYLRDRTEATDVCGYCGKRLIWRELLPFDAHIISKTQTKLVWTYKKKSHAMTPATIEHIRPLSKGGGNLLAKLMAACFKCNNERSRKPIEKPKTKPVTKILKNRKK